MRTYNIGNNFDLTSSVKYLIERKKSQYKSNREDEEYLDYDYDSDFVSEYFLSNSVDLEEKFEVLKNNNFLDIVLTLQRPELIASLFNELSGEQKIELLLSSRVGDQVYLIEIMLILQNHWNNFFSNITDISACVLLDLFCEQLKDNFSDYDNVCKTDFMRRSLTELLLRSNYVDCLAQNFEFLVEHKYLLSKTVCDEANVDLLDTDNLLGAVVNYDRSTKDIKLRSTSTYKRLTASSWGDFFWFKQSEKQYLNIDRIRYDELDEEVIPLTLV